MPARSSFFPNEGGTLPCAEDRGGSVCGGRFSADAEDIDAEEVDAEDIDAEEADAENADGC